MNSRMKDLLVLVSRLDEKRADIRFLLRQDPDIQREVHTYLEDVNWLSRRPEVRPSIDGMAAGRAGLISALKQPASRKRRSLALPPLVGAIATAGVLLSAAMGAQAATTGVPAPVSDVLSSVGIVFSPAHEDSNGSYLDGSSAPISVGSFGGLAPQN